MPERLERWLNVQYVDQRYNNINRAFILFLLHIDRQLNCIELYLCCQILKKFIKIFKLAKVYL